MGDGTIFQFHGVSFAYRGGERLLHDLSYPFERGAFYLIGGPSGIGKSTVLRLMNRLEDPSGGEIRFNGEPVSAYTPAVLRRSVVFIQQTPTVLDATVRNNLLLPFRFAANRHLIEPTDSALMGLLEKVDLMPETLNRNALQLSVGQLQRICLIRGLLLSPQVILLDEPTSALDEESGTVVQTMVEAASLESGITVVMVNHRRFHPQTVTPVSLKLEGGRLVENS